MERACHSGENTAKGGDKGEGGNGWGDGRGEKREEANLVLWPVSVRTPTAPRNRGNTLLARLE